MGLTNSNISRPDGSLDFSLGVDSLKTPTAQSQNNPNGLPRNALAWLRNGTVRGGGISPRPGWKFIRKIHGPEGLYQGGWMYDPDAGDPYLVCSISGHLFKAPPDTTQPVVDLTRTAFTSNPFIKPTTPYVVLQNLNVPQVSHLIIGTTLPSIPVPAYPLLNLVLPVVAPLAPAGITGWMSDAGVITPGSIQVPPLGQNVKASLAGFYGGNIGDEIIITYKFEVWKSSHTYLGITAIGLRNLNAPTGAYVTVLPQEYNFPMSGFDALAIGVNMELWVSLSLYYAKPKVGEIITFEHKFKVVAFNTDPNLVDKSALFNSENPATEPHAYFQQAEQFLVAQAGDSQTLPLIWDGEWLYRSLGINNTAVVQAPGIDGINQIPPATAMDYYMGRLWYTQGRNYAAGDIVGNANSGTRSFNLRDSVINVTENPLAMGGDGFAVPDNAGPIRALRHPSNINTQLGQGQLYIFTRKTVYALTVPVNRTQWIAADADTMPLQTVVQIDNGAVGDRCITSVNGDLYYQSFDPAIRSIVTAVRNFPDPGNTPISANVIRVLQDVDRGLMTFASAVTFDNRLLQCTLPKQTPQGVVYQGIIPLDFVPLSTFQQKLPPAWEGIWDGLDILQMFTGDFGGNQRCFATVVSRLDGSIDLWELTTADKFDRDDTRIALQVEFPAFTWGDEFALKRLVSAELWADRIFGQVLFEMDYRPDGETCWTEWSKWIVCTPRDSRDLGGPAYPIIQCGPCYAATLTLPLPPVVCESCDQGRPSDIAYQHQTRLTITGYCRIRGLLLHAAPVERKLYEGKVC